MLFSRHGKGARPIARILGLWSVVCLCPLPIPGHPWPGSTSAPLSLLADLRHRNSPHIRRPTTQPAHRPLPCPFPLSPRRAPPPAVPCTTCPSLPSLRHHLPTTFLNDLSLTTCPLPLPSPPRRPGAASWCEPARAAAPGGLHHRHRRGRFPHPLGGACGLCRHNSTYLSFRFPLFLAESREGRAREGRAPWGAQAWAGGQ